MNARSEARERVLTTAYDLFCRHGIRAVGIDTIIDRSGVAKATVYRHFGSKDDLALAVMARREELWTHEWLEAEILARATEPAERLLAIFDVFDEWFHEPTFEGCFFINALLEYEDRTHAIHRSGRDRLAHIRGIIERLAARAGVADPEALARQWHILMKGSIVAAHEGDAGAAERAQHMGRLLLAELGALPADATS